MLDASLSFLSERLMSAKLEVRNDIDERLQVAILKEYTVA